jgi:outer membrane protein assembly factor BamB/glyoxylase-like metal-dependent hydrolase (beta-lactamase superfamily II)
MRARAWLFASLFWVPLPASAAALDAAALEGQWLGTIGSARERIEVGLEFRRGADGTLALRLTQPISNYFDVDPGGELRIEGDAIVLDSLALKLQLRDGKLVGHFPGPRSQAELSRSDHLPQALPPPAVPRGPEPVWRTRLSGQIYASPVVFDELIYIGSTGGVLNALRAVDGSPAWTFRTAAPIHAAVAVDAEAVYVSSDDGMLHKLDRDDGTAVWRYELGGSRGGRVLPHPQVFDWDWRGATPLLADGTVYLGGADGRMHAIDAASGAARWVHAGGSRIRQGAALEDGRLYYGAEDGTLRALDAATGTEIWRFASGAAVDTDSLLHADALFFGNRGGGLYALDAADGSERWRLYFWGSWVESTPVMVDGVLYVGSSDLRRVSAIDPRTGTPLWRTDVHGWSFGTPLVDGERIYAGAAGGAPYFIEHLASFNVLDRRSGDVLTRWPLPDGGGHQWGIAGSPVLAADKVVVGLIEGAVLAFPRDLAAIDTQPQPVAPGVALLQGTFEPGTQPDGNSVILQGEQGLVVIDSGRHAAHAQRLLDHARRQQQPIIALINTHWHLDHVSGNVALRAAYPRIEVHASRAIEHALTGFLARYRGQLEGALAGTADAAQKAAWRLELQRIDSGDQLMPTAPVTADGERVIGGLPLQVHLEDNAVSGGDVWLFEPGARLLIAGDLVTLPAPLFDTACASGWQQALQRIRAVDFDRLIPGHGAPLSKPQFEIFVSAFDQLLLCAASDADAATCAAGWRDMLGELLPPDQKAFSDQLLSYYIGQVLRGPAAGQQCKASRRGPVDG